MDLPTQEHLYYLWFIQLIVTLMEIKKHQMRKMHTNPKERRVEMSHFIIHVYLLYEKGIFLQNAKARIRMIGDWAEWLVSGVFGQ